MFYKALSESSRHYIAKWWIKRKKGNKKLWTEEQEQRAKEIFGDEEWESMSRDDKDVAAFDVALTDRDYQWQITGVEFVRYDEKLYKALVKIGAVAQAKCQKKQVSVDPVELGRYQG